METEFLDVAENEEGIADLSIFNEFLKVLVLQDELVDPFLGLGQRQPHNQVGFEWQFQGIQGSANGFGADHFKYSLFGPPEEMLLIHLPQLEA